MSAIIYLEGGGDSKELHVRCREGFRGLLEKCEFSGRMPQLRACGGREATFEDFVIAHNNGKADYVAMWVDSEDPIVDIDSTWAHLKSRDGWDCPEGAGDDQVLFSTTCMETLIVADHRAIKTHYNGKVQDSALPPLHGLETRDRHDVQDRLIRATRGCSNAYSKGKRSFEVLAKLTPTTLAAHLPSFARIRRVLEEKL